MDQTTIRLILLALGSLLVAGIYLWDKYKNRIGSTHGFTQAKPKNKVAHCAKPKHSAILKNTAKTPLDSKSEKTRSEPFIGDKDEKEPISIIQPGFEEPMIAQDVIKDDQLALDLADDVEESFLLDAELLNKAPRLILQLYLVARTEPLTAAQIYAAAGIVGLQHGAMQIYNRPSVFPDRPLFSMASMLEPGILPIDPKSEFSTPGLTVFTELPGAKDGSAIYAEMLFSAQRLADLLQADLQDETHSALTRQAIEHTRDNILEHQRQIELLKNHE